MTDLTYLSLEKLKTISLTELLKLKPNLDMAIEELKQEKKEALIAELIKQAGENGISLDDFEGMLSKKETQKQTLSPKYRNKNNENQTWSGHGRKPKWVEEWIANGNNLDDLLIEKSNP